jgi:hypothetical protein
MDTNITNVITLLSQAINNVASSAWWGHYDHSEDIEQALVCLEWAKKSIKATEGWIEAYEANLKNRYNDKDNH